MIQLGIDNTKRLYLIAGRSFAGDKGTTGSVEMPTTFGGVNLSAFDTGYVYIKYGEVYEQIELAGLTGTQIISFDDAIFAEAGTISIWAELQDTNGDLVQKTSILNYIVEAAETYSAPAEAEPGAGGEE